MLGKATATHISRPDDYDSVGKKVPTGEESSFSSTTRLP